MNLVRESKVHRVERSKVWKTLLKHHWDVEMLNTNPCFDEGKILEVIFNTGQDLNLINGSNVWKWISDDDLAIGMKLFSSLHNCPESLHW